MKVMVLLIGPDVPVYKTHHIDEEGPRQPGQGGGGGGGGGRVGSLSYQQLPGINLSSASAEDAVIVPPLISSIHLIWLWSAFNPSPVSSSRDL